MVSFLNGSRTCILPLMLIELWKFSELFNQLHSNATAEFRVWNRPLWADYRMFLNLYVLVNENHTAQSGKPTPEKVTLMIQLHLHLLI